MKNFLLVLIVFLATATVHGQITFQKNFGGAGVDYGYSAQQTIDGGYIIAGYTQSFGAGSADVYLIKTNANGDTLWTKTFGGTNNDRGNSVQQTADGGYIITGITNSFGAGLTDVYLIKTDSNGNALWSKTFGGTGNDQGNSVQQTTDGGYIIAGMTIINGAGTALDVYLIKTDANGDSLWTKTYGGNEIDYGYSTRQTSDGGYIVAGYTTNFTAGWIDIYLIKTNASGDTLWTKSYGGSGSDHARSIQQTSDGGYIVAGYTNSFGAGLLDVCLIKTDASGNSIWTKTYGGVNDDYSYDVLQTTDGGYIIAGITNSFGAGSDDVYLIKTTATGDTLWTTTFGDVNSDGAYSLTQTTDGGYAILGRGNNLGSSNVYLIKANANGNAICNQKNTTTIINTPAKSDVIHPTFVASGGVTGNPTTLSGKGATVTTLCTSVNTDEDFFQQTISVFPSPFSSTTTIQTNNFLTAATLSVFNALGQQVKQIKNISGSSIVVSRDNLPCGLYFIRLIQDNKLIAIKKTIIADN